MRVALLVCLRARDPVLLRNSEARPSGLAKLGLPWPVFLAWTGQGWAGLGSVESRIM